MKENKDTRPTGNQRLKTCLKNNALIVCLLLALVVGVSLGAGLRTLEPPFSKRQIMYLRFPGDMLMSMLTFLIVPLIISSLVSGLASLDTRSSGRMGMRAIVYYLATTFAAVVLGIILTVTIRPGSRGRDDAGDDHEETTGDVVNTADTFLDLIRQCFPNNILEMCFLKPVTKQVLINSTVSNQTEYDPVVTKVDGMNVLGMVVFSIFFGVIIGRMEERGRHLAELFETLCEATMSLVQLVIWYSPIGIACLIAAKIVEMDDVGETFEKLTLYFLTVMAGLTIHGLVTLPLIYGVIVRKNPYRYLYGMLGPIVTALGTSSSSATMPVTMRCLEEDHGIDKRVVKFVIPVGATINMDGTALYEAVAVLFIGQMRGEDMDLVRIITISITATAAAIGAAGVPQAGLVTMVIVLSAVGFPADDVALILAIDWLLDRFRTAINVLGDSFGAGIVYHLSRHELLGSSIEREIEITSEERKPLLSDVTSSGQYGGAENVSFTANIHTTET